MGLPRSFLAAAISSSLGTQLAVQALTLVVISAFKPTGTELGLIKAFYLLPFVAMSLQAGIWIDRHERGLTLLALTGAKLAVLVGLFLVGPRAHTLRLFYWGAVGLGATHLLYELRLGIVIQKAERGHGLVRTNGLLAVVQSIGDIGAPLAIPYLSSQLGDYVPFGVASGFLLVALVLLVPWQPLPSSAPTSCRAGTPARRGAVNGGAFEGLRYVWSRAPLRQLALTIGSWNFCYHGGMTSFLVMATHTLGLSQSLIGTCFTLYGAGFLAGSLLAPRLVAMVGLGRLLFTCLGLTLISVLLQSLGPWVPCRDYYLWACFFAVGVPTAVSQVCNSSLRQLLTDESAYGRVLSTVRLMTWAPIPTGAYLAGIACDRFPPPLVLGTIAGAGIILLVLGYFRFSISRLQLES